MSELPDLASLTHQQKDELIVPLYHRLVVLHARVLALTIGAPYAANRGPRPYGPETSLPVTQTRGCLSQQE